MAYATLTQVRAYLKFGASETTDNDLIEYDLIPRAQKIIERVNHRVYEAAAASVRRFDAVRDVRSDTLFLDEDLCEITSVTNGDGVTVSASEYVTEPRNVTPYSAIKLKASSGKAWTYVDDPENAIQVNGKWAYSTSAPADIVQACIRLTVWLYRQKDSSADIDRPLLTNDGVTIMPMSLPKDVQQLLAPYKRLV